MFWIYKCKACSFTKIQAVQATLLLSSLQFLAVNTIVTCIEINTIVDSSPSTLNVILTLSLLKSVWRCPRIPRKFLVCWRTKSGVHSECCPESQGRYLVHWYSSLNTPHVFTSANFMPVCLQKSGRRFLLDHWSNIIMVFMESVQQWPDYLFTTPTPNCLAFDIMFVCVSVFSTPCPSASCCVPSQPDGITWAVQ